jgi:hypothetical protein
MRLNFKHPPDGDLVTKKTDSHLYTKIINYLKECFGKDINLMAIERLGEGIHGAGYLIKFRRYREEMRLIMKTLFPSEFGHDHFSDRAQVLLLANANYNEMPKHVKALDVVGEAPDRLISIKDTGEFYIFMEEAKGKPYFSDLNATLKRGKLTPLDIERARVLARFLADVHKVKYRERDAKILYRRRIRDLIGHGECIMGVIDTYDNVEFISEEELLEYAGKCLTWWGKIRNKSERLCRVHGDYHPGNIWFHVNDFKLLDRSRGSWGDPADDVSCLGVNFIYYAIKETGNFEGSFAELFRIFLKTYLEATKDDGFFQVAAPFFAFRILVLANPRFYPDDTAEVKRKLIDFGHSILDADRFEVEEISNYL